MARKVTFQLVDDIDGSTASETITFSLDGTSYEIDLNDGHARELRDGLSRYVTHGTKLGRGPGAKTVGGRARKPASAARDTAAVRVWARERGYNISDRGRIPTRILEEFDTAH